MEKLELLAPGKIYKIVQHGNGEDALFFEFANKAYFKALAHKHLSPVCKILDCSLRQREIELILEFRDEGAIPEKYREKLHMPLSNLFNSYAKSINKRYGRKGSLFRTRFEREQLLISKSDDYENL